MGNLLELYVTFTEARKFLLMLPLARGLITHFVLCLNGAFV